MTAAPEPLYIETSGRRLFALYHAADATPKGCVLMLPPFAEEMNMSRRMSYLAGRAVSAAGFGFLHLDLTGTGESSGDFEDADWEIWRQDAAAAARWLQEKTGHTPNVLGLRAGALLAADTQFDRAGLILWQPVGNGETMLNQFLRIRVAAGLTGGGDKETTKDLRAEWTAGRSVEIAGYTVSANLAAGLDRLRLADMAPATDTPVTWMETGKPDAGPSPASQRVIKAWSDTGVTLETVICQGEPFWTIQETTVAPQLIDATLAALGAS